MLYEGTYRLLGVLYCTLAEWRKQRTRKTIIRPKDTKESNDEVTRLIKENAELKKANSILKDAGVTTIVEANVFLEKYIEKFNAQFAICEGVKSCRVNISQEQIDYALVTIAKRTVDCGNGIRLNNKYYGTFDSYGNQIYIKPKTGRDKNERTVYVYLCACTRKNILRSPNVFCSFGHRMRIL